MDVMLEAALLMAFYGFLRRSSGRGKAVGVGGVQQVHGGGFLGGTEALLENCPPPQEGNGEPSKL